MPTQGYLYILASKKHGTLYVGVTSNLANRVEEHKSNAIPGFTARYSVHNLVFYEHYDRIGDAIEQEKRIKNWKRKWKIALIEQFNPGWKDLSGDL